MNTSLRQYIYTLSENVFDFRCSTKARLAELISCFIASTFFSYFPNILQNQKLVSCNVTLALLPLLFEIQIVVRFFFYRNLGLTFKSSSTKLTTCKPGSRRLRWPKKNMNYYVNSNVNITARSSRKTGDFISACTNNANSRGCVYLSFLKKIWMEQTNT